MEKFSDEVLVAKVEELVDIKDYENRCESCKRLVLIHTEIHACTRSETVDDDELIQIWSEFRIWMRNVMIIVRMNREKKLMEEEKMTNWENMMIRLNKTNEESWKRILI